MKSKLIQLGVCRESIEWCGNRTPQQAYEECERGDWLLWMAIKCGVNQKIVALTACACADTVLYLTEGVLPCKVLKVVRKHLKGKATLSEVKKAANAAFKVAIATEVDEAYNAGVAAVYAADAVSNAIDAPYAATAAVAAIIHTDVDREDKHRELADIVRKRIPFEKFA